MRVPDFVIRQLYVAGSLANEGDGFRLQARNGLGDGTIVGIGRISVDGCAIEPAAITAVRSGEDVIHRALDVSPAAPVAFRRGDVVTFRVAGRTLSPGEHAFEVELRVKDMGLVTLALKDRVR
jgi:hypothetical protein